MTIPSFSKRFHSAPKGFTFVELLVALAVIGITATCAYQSIVVISNRFHRLHSLSTVDSEREKALSTVAQDLRCAYFSQEDNSTTFIGRAGRGKQMDSLQFSRTDSDQNEKFIHVNYFVERERGKDLLNLWRECDGRKSLLSRDVVRFQVRYLDGTNWNENWGWDPLEERPMDGIRGLPTVVSVDLLLRRDEHPREAVLMPIMTALIYAAQAG